MATHRNHSSAISRYCAEMHVSARHSSSRTASWAHSSFDFGLRFDMPQLSPVGCPKSSTGFQKTAAAV